MLGEHLLVDDYVLLRGRDGGTAAYREPLDWMPVEEGPRRHDDEKCKCCAGEADLEGKSNVLEEEAYREGNKLW